MKIEISQRERERGREWKREAEKIDRSCKDEEGYMGISGGKVISKVTIVGFVEAQASMVHESWQ